MVQLLLYSIAYITMIYAVVLLTKKNRHSTDIILAIWLFLLSTVYSLSNYEWEVCLTFTHCVFLYLYIKCSLTRSEFSFKYLVHFIPFFISVITIIVYPQIIYKSFVLTYTILIVYIAIYFGASIRLLVNYKYQNKDNPVTGYSPNLTWLYLIVAITIFGHFIKMLPIVASYMGEDRINIAFVNLIVLLSLNVVGLKAIRLELTFFKKTASEDKTKSYSTYNLKESEIISLEQKLVDLMVNQKIYLTSDLSLKDLSESLNVPSHNLSFLLNTKFNQNFYEFINNYRLEEVKNELINPQKKHLSIYAIASDCGFNSQSTFNRIFKQKVGISPSKYREQHINISEDFK